MGGDDAWNSMVKDEKQLTDIIRKDYPNLPIFMFGHSMSSMIAQDFMARWGMDVKGVVLSGTAVNKNQHAARCPGGFASGCRAARGFTCASMLTPCDLVLTSATAILL